VIAIHDEKGAGRIFECHEYGWRARLQWDNIRRVELMLMANNFTSGNAENIESWN
jgi:hypothetical protein